MLNINNDNTVEFTYKQTGYLNWLKEFANVLNIKAIDNTITLSDATGQGNSSAFSIDEGFTACVNNFKLNEDYVLKRYPTDSYGVIIYLYHFETLDNVEFKLNDVAINFDNGNHYALRIISAKTEQQLKFGKTTAVRGISIYLENEWIIKNLNHKVLEVFNYLDEVNYFKEFINAKQLRLMEEILNVSADHAYSEIFIKSRILRIIDKLLENFLQRDISESPEKINEDDFKVLQQVELILTSSYDEAFPGIEKLSKLSFMSESKLKKLFKQSFGMGLHEYFQKNRMHRAKEFIISRKYSITEVGTKLGYQNLSNFSSAFRKEFNCLPSEIPVL